jgi:hypothetical protein
MNMKILKPILLLLLSLSAYSQANYYVSPTGNNANNGSLSSPWKTIQHALNTVPTNSVINVLTGVYTEKLRIPINGITLKNQTGNSPIIDAKGITIQEPIIDIIDKNNITIDGFELRNNIQNNAQAVSITGTSSNVTVKNCKIHDIHFSSDPNQVPTSTTNALGIVAYGTNSTTAITNLKISNNQIYQCRLGFSEGIAVRGNVDGFEVSNNLIYDLTNIGINLAGSQSRTSPSVYDQARNGIVKKNTVHDCLSPIATSAGIYVDGGKLIIIENNTSYHNGYGIEVGCENKGRVTDAIKVRSNIVYDNKNNGIALGGYGFPDNSGKVTNSTITNNTTYFNDYSNSGSGELYLSYSENTVIENNIFYPSTKNKIGFTELTQPSIVFDYNAFYSDSGNVTINWKGTAYLNFSSFVTGSNTNKNSLLKNPNFVLPNITNPNFHIQANSPCINTGNPSYVVGANEFDIDNQARTNGGRIDCGADEFTALGVNDFNRQAVNVFPNPVDDRVTIQTNSDAVFNVEIFNQLGQIVYKKAGFENENFNTSELKTGIYILRVFNEDFQFTDQIIKR